MYNTCVAEDVTTFIEEPMLSSILSFNIQY